MFARMGNNPVSAVYSELPFRNVCMCVVRVLVTQKFMSTIAFIKAKECQQKTSIK